MYFAAAPASAANTGAVTPAAQALRTGAAIGSENANTPFRLSTGAQPTSTVGPPVSACSARTVAVAGTTVPLTARTALAAGTIGEPAALTTVKAVVVTGTPVITAVTRPGAVTTRS